MRLRLALVACLAGIVAVPATAMDYYVQGQVLYLEGEIGTRDLRKMRSTLKEHPNLKTVVLLDVPGSNDDDTNVQVIRLIRRAGLNTHLVSDSFVASGGTDLFLAGVHRTMERGAEVGVHSWSDGRRDGADYPRTHPDHRLFLDLYRELGIPADFYWFTLEAASADDLYIMSDREIMAFGLVTARIK